MRLIALILSALVSLALPLTQPVCAQSLLSSTESVFTKHHTQVKLLLPATAAKPGDTVFAGFDLKMDPEWHTYWKNAGDAGTPTKIQWTLPAGVSAGEIQWPLPRKLPPAEVTTYGYEDEVVLIVPLTISNNVAPGALNLSAKVSWLECKDVCIPASQSVAATLNIGNESQPSADAANIQSWQNQTPKENPPFSFQVWWEKPASDDTRPLILAGSQASGAKLSLDNADFFPDPGDKYEVQSATETMPASAGFSLRKQVKKFSGDWPQNASGVIVVGSGDQRIGYEVNVPIGEKAPGAGTAAPESKPPAGAMLLPGQSLGSSLGYAFLGGLILNIMPCVLPVIALKILGFVSEARSEPRRVRFLGLIYALGVIVSFLVLAAIVIGVKAAGHHAGWGMQFSSPIFTVCLTTLVLLVALNLFGVFEVILGGRAMDAAGVLAGKSGAPGAFFNGVLATTLATPCTAPFLAPALGFAFQQSASIIILIFITVGLGLAAPYLVLSWQPAWLKFLPKPGAWMEKFKNAMGFPMLATVIWLFNIAAGNYGKNVLWLGIFLVIVAFAAWIYGEFVQRGRSHRAVAAIIALLMLAGGYAYALEKELNWRTPVIESDWQPWSPEAVAAARAAGKPVLVDFTADWCLTCQVNKKTSIDVSSVREKLKSLHAVTLLGDYTHFPDAITTELNRYQRAGVPLVLVFPKNPDAQPIVLPSLLTPGIVLSALERAK